MFGGLHEDALAGLIEQEDVGSLRASNEKKEKLWTQFIIWNARTDRSRRMVNDTLLVVYDPGLNDTGKVAP